MSYYTDLDADLGLIEEAERDCREMEFERNRKRSNERSRIAAEVRKQLRARGIEKQPIIGVKVDVNCKNCGKHFEARKADVQRGWGKFCSKSCKASKQAYNGYLHR